MDAIRPELAADARHAPLLALVDDRPVGFALVWLIADEMHLVNLAVDPQWRRAGIAHALVATMLEVARKRSMVRVTLEVRDTNEAARRLYLGFGFRDVAVRPHYYPDTREDAVIMLLEPGQSGPG